ncbi:MAG: dTDP-4-dehydrorhamnose 3,5-epimerase [Tannerellaceae bacterium]|jgi:dTDP-4-dehydrorhamnose 3,5-epimerase|nr:dTDP-4-dehydrorhamnose 3,5-epimerase [Tannerellaceae bacterium]
MNFIETAIPGVWMMEPEVLHDTRGYFFEAFKQAEFEAHIGEVCFIQENESCSSRGVLRGLHYQLAPFSQAKLVRVIQGAVWDVAVDLRRDSPTFGQHIAVELSAGNKRQLFIPRGFAHGFLVLEERTVFTYKVDNPYMPAYERSVRYDDPHFGIDWRRIGGVKELTLSDKDRQAPLLADAETNFIYHQKQSL